MPRTISFSIDEPIPLPKDIHIWVPKSACSVEDVCHPETRRKPEYLHVAGSCDGNACGECSCAGTVSVTPHDANDSSAFPDGRRFLAVSPSSASYIAVDTRFLRAFMLLRDGYSPSTVYKWLEDDIPSDEWLLFLKNFFETLVLRNFFEGAQTVEDSAQRPVLHLYVTNRCNLRCTHCYMSSGKPLPQGEVDTTARLAAIDTFTALRRKGLISFSGGEALTDPELFTLVDHAKEAGHEVELYTNGLLVTPSTAQRIVNSVDQLQISLDGTTSEANDPIRGKGSFNKIVSAINLIDKADRTRNPSFLYRVAFTLTASNCDDIESNILHFLSSLELQRPHKISVGVVGRIGRAAENSDVFVKMNDLPAIQARVLRKFVAGGRMRRPNFTINKYSKSCGIGSSVTVAADGNIYPCSVTEQPSLGNVRDNDALSAMKSVFAFRDATNVDSVAGCASCSLRYFCQGKCRVSNLHTTGSMLESRCDPTFKAAKVESFIAGFRSFVP